jgi:8-oxo-dGTP pyrophosphatase MutT (NUDIX family)
MTDRTKSDPTLARIRRALMPLEITDGTDAITQQTQRRAAVLLPFVKRDVEDAYGGWHLLYTQRPETMPSHAGQISFPGGKVEVGETTLQAAIRETEEEVGLGAKALRPIGRLPSFDAADRFRVTPFAAIVDPVATIVIDEHEVAEAFEVPLAFLMNPSNHTAKQMSWGEHTANVWFMPYDGPNGTHRNIWGMTAGMTRRIYEGGFADADAA